MTSVDWARLAAEGAWVLHEASVVVDRLVAYHDGVEDRWVSSVNGAAVDAPVVETAQGHGFMADPGGEGLRPLGEREAAFFAGMQHGLAELVREFARVGAGSGLDPELALSMVAAALRAQLSALSPPPAA